MKRKLRGRRTVQSNNKVIYALSSNDFFLKFDFLAQREAEQRMRGHMTAMEAPLYQSFQVYILNRVRVRSCINLGRIWLFQTHILFKIQILGISGEKIEIDPVAQHKTTSQLWGKKKAATYDITRIAACEITHQRTNKSSFRLVHQPTGKINLKFV
jgi:hypothetical protein